MWHDRDCGRHSDCECDCECACSLAALLFCLMDGIVSAQRSLGTLPVGRDPVAHWSALPGSELELRASRPKALRAGPARH